MVDLLKSLQTSDDLQTKIDCLQDLSQIILLSGEGFVSTVDSPTLIKLLEKLITNSKSPQILLLSIRCLQNMVQSCPQISRYICHLNETIFSVLSTNKDNKEIVEVIIDLIELLTHDQNQKMLLSNTLSRVLSVFPKCSLPTKQKIAETAANMLRAIPQDCFKMVKEAIPDLCVVLQSNDPKVLNLSSLALFRIRKHFLKNLDYVPLIKPVVFQTVVRNLKFEIRQMLKPFTITRVIRFLSDITKFSSSQIIKVAWREGVFQLLNELMDLNSVIERDARIPIITLLSSLIPDRTSIKGKEEEDDEDNEDEDNDDYSSYSSSEEEYQRQKTNINKQKKDPFYSFTNNTDPYYGSSPLFKSRRGRGRGRSRGRGRGRGNYSSEFSYKPRYNYSNYSSYNNYNSYNSYNSYNGYNGFGSKYNNNYFSTNQPTTKTKTIKKKTSSLFGQTKNSIPLKAKKTETKTKPLPKGNLFELGTEQLDDLPNIDEEETWSDYSSDIDLKKYEPPKLSDIVPIKKIKSPKSPKKVKKSVKIDESPKELGKSVKVEILPNEKKQTKIENENKKEKKIQLNTMENETIKQETIKNKNEKKNETIKSKNEKTNTTKKEKSKNENEKTKKIKNETIKSKNEKTETTKNENEAIKSKNEKTETIKNEKTEENFSYSFSDEVDIFGFKENEETVLDFSNDLVQEFQSTNKLKKNKQLEESRIKRLGITHKISEKEKEKPNKKKNGFEEFFHKPNTTTKGNTFTFPKTKKINKKVVNNNNKDDFSDEDGEEEDEKDDDILFPKFLDGFSDEEKKKKN